MLVGNEKKVRLISIVLFTLGIIIAIINGAKVTTGTEILLPFFVGIGIAAFGLIFWQISERRLHKSELEVKVKSGNNPFSLIKSAFEEVSLISEKISTNQIAHEEICSSIDKIQEQYLVPFVDLRSTILDMLGYKKGSDILIKIAHGERLLNRAWSCVADGHLEEGKKALPEVISSFKEVLEEVKKPQS